MMALINWPQRAFINISSAEKIKCSSDTRSKMVKEMRANASILSTVQ